MDRGLKAAFLFSLVVVAQADRALTAHKPSTGGLHAVAILRTLPSGAYTGAAAPTETTFTSVGNYMITNGNGTWTYSYYSANGFLNGNDAGMGGDWIFPGTNTAWFNANGAPGGAVQTTITPVLLPSFDDQTSTLPAQLNIEAPAALYSLGLTSVVFTGAKTGIAVGRYAGYAEIDQDSLTSPVTVLTSKAMNILLTFDGATTWSRATGMPKNNLLTTNAAQVAGSWGTTLTVPPYPSTSVGDLTCVFMASKTLGWAVGGNEISLATVLSSGAALGPAVGTSALAANAAAAAAALTPFGLIIMTQNGGTVWKNVPIFVSFSNLVTLWKNNDPSLKTIYQTPIPGILFGIQSDASGKHVYAVGSGSSLYSSAAGTAPLTFIASNVPVALGLQVKPSGTILYSGNSGMSWVAQEAPTLYSGVSPYTLFDVAVQKGTTAIAVGGSPSQKASGRSAGTILYTMNGGFSWTQAVYPSSTGASAPSFTCVALQPAVAGVQTVWVGGFTTRFDAATTTTVASATGFYPVSAVAGFTPTGITTTSLVSSGVPRSRGQIYTILVSKDGGKTFAAAPTAGLPTGYVVTSFTSPTSLATDRSVYGITWDNALHGWVYGFGYIMSTQNGGATWVYETPSDVGVLTVNPKVVAIASVPTTY